MKGAVTYGVMYRHKTHVLRKWATKSTGTPNSDHRVVVSCQARGQQGGRLRTRTGALSGRTVNRPGTFYQEMLIALYDVEVRHLTKSFGYCGVNFGCQRADLSHHTLDTLLRRPDANTDLPRAHRVYPAKHVTQRVDPSFSGILQIGVFFSLTVISSTLTWPFGVCGPSGFFGVIADAARQTPSWSRYQLPNK